MHAPCSLSLPRVRACARSIAAELGDRIASFGRGLRALGMTPLPLATSNKVTDKYEAMTGPHTLLIFEETCADWMTAALGAMSQSMPVATSYSTLGMAAVAEAINQTSAPAILCNYKDVCKVATLEKSCESLKTIIYSRNYTEAEAKPVGEAYSKELAGCGLKVLSVDEVMELGDSGKHKTVTFAEPTPDHVGLIMCVGGKCN